MVLEKYLIITGVINIMRLQVIMLMLKVALQLPQVITLMQKAFVLRP